MDNDGGVDAATAAIHAAMMEELGLARRDALPLEDRNNGYLAGAMPIPNKRLAVDNPAAAWYNLMDDGESADEVLEDFANGQLYRMRRGGGDMSRGRGGHANGNTGRSLGGISKRGGHSSANGRGRQSTQMVNPRIEKSGNSSSSNNQIYFNDARHRGNRNQVIDSGLARMHREAELSRSKRKTGFSKKLPSTAAKAAQPSRAPLSTPVRRPASSSYTLASPAVFLAHANVGSSPSIKPAQTTACGNPSSSILDMPIIPPSSPPSSQQNGGLETSRWALPKTTSHLPARASAATTPPPATFKAQTSASESSSSAPKETAERVVVEEPPCVKISKNESTFRIGIARLVRYDDFSPLSLELQVDDKVLVNDVLTKNATLKVDGSYVTYRAGYETDCSTVWRIQFQLPGPAQRFANAHKARLELLTNSGYFLRPLEQQRTKPPIIIPSSASPATPTTTSPFPPVPTVLPFPMNRISSGTYADLAIIDGHQVLVSLDENERELLQEDENQKPVTSAIEDLLSLMSEDIVTSTLQVLNKEYGGSFIDHVSQIAKGTALENDQEFLLRSKRVFGGGLSSSRFAKPISEITEELVAEFLKKSETFSKFPPEFVNTYTKETSKKILERAQNPRNDQRASIKVESAEVAAESASPNIENEKTLKFMDADSDGTVDETVKTKVEMDLDKLSETSRIVYSSDQILGLRTGIEHVSGKLRYSLNEIPRLVQPKKIKSIIAPAAAPRLSPEEWKTKFSNVQTDHDTAQYSKHSNVQTEDKETKNGEVSSPVSFLDTTVDDTGRNVHLNTSQLSGKHSQSKGLGGDLSGFASTEPQEVKNEVKTDHPTLVLPTKRGLSTSRYADKSPVSQASVLRAASGFHTPSRQTASEALSTSNPPGNKSSLPASPARPAQEHDSSLSNALLTANKSPKIEIIKPSAMTPKDSKNASISDQNFAVGAQQEKALHVDEAQDAGSLHVRELPCTTLLSRNEGTISMAIRVQDTKINEADDITLLPRAPISTDSADAKQQHTKLPIGGRHHPTNSDCERLAKRLEGLDLKADNSYPATAPTKAQRTVSPTLEKMLEKKGGLEKSQWASESVSIPKHQPRVLTHTITEYKKSSKSTLPGQTNAWTSHLSVSPVQEPHTQLGVPAYQTVLIPDPATGRLIEVTGMVKAGSVPVVAHMPAALSQQHYVGTSNDFSSPGLLAFPPRPSMLERPFSDSESEETLKPTAPVFTPSRTGIRGATTALRPALSPVKPENSNTQQDIQERLNKSLAGRGGSHGRQ